MVDATFFDYVEIVLLLVGLLLLFYLLIDQRNRKNSDLEMRKILIIMENLTNMRTMEFLSRYMDIVYGMHFENYDDWVVNYGPRANKEAYTSYVYVTGWYQNLGYLLQKGILDTETIAEQVFRPMSFITLWEKIEPIVQYHRERINPTAYESFEYLVNEMRALLERRKQMTDEIS